MIDIEVFFVLLKTLWVKHEDTLRLIKYMFIYLPVITPATHAQVSTTSLSKETQNCLLWCDLWIEHMCV